ncbi:MAG TPA: NADH-quinone oxidoreductase subunit C [Coriobacteriia bacterium]|nr:NADH-quinone oxidoreductase subunit C [Coriobacteriia bacterium]
MSESTATKLTTATATAGSAVLHELDGVFDVDVLGPGGIACARTGRSDLLAVARTLRDSYGFGHLDLLTAIDNPPDVGGLDMLYGLVRRDDGEQVMLRVALAEDSLSVATLSAIWPAANPLEREVYDLYGVHFEGHPFLRRLLLRDDFDGHPLRKSYVMGEHGVSAEQVTDAVQSHGIVGPEGDATVAAFPFVGTEKNGDPSLRSQRLILNVGPQHPSTHGVLHLYLVLDGESVIAAQPTHGYLHRCIEKLCESRSYKACTALIDRCDYVSGFHQELAYMLALEELLGIEPTPKADYIRVLMSELVRISSHHTWFTAAGFDTGALTPFLYAFIDREEILDFFEAVTGARMMFNYFRPGGVKDDIQPEAAERLRAWLKRFDASVDEYEAMLTGNEIFRARTRGVGILTCKDIEDWSVTGPLARGSGYDIDLRRDAPYAAYDRIPVNVPLGTSGDTFDRYVIRVAEMRESARIALAALDGMPEGPHLAEGVPRNLRPPVGAAYRKVESPRGELGVLVVSDGSDKPWRLKVRSPALSNLHVAPYMLEDCKVGDVIPVVGSIDVVMGEIDR